MIQGVLCWCWPVGVCTRRPSKSILWVVHTSQEPKNYPIGPSDGVGAHLSPLHVHVLALIISKECIVLVIHCMPACKRAHSAHPQLVPGLPSLMSTLYTSLMLPPLGRSEGGRWWIMQRVAAGGSCRSALQETLPRWTRQGWRSSAGFPLYK
jgi:hypothetical protein